MVKPPGRRDQRHSGATGGPAAGGGLNYQVDFAVQQTLESISRALVDPLEQPEISMEPRVITEKKLTCWDVRLSEPDIVTEAKLRPKNDEVLEWLDRVESGMTQNADREFQLFYGRGAGPLIGAIERLCRIAKEADGDGDSFAKRVHLEQNQNVDKVLSRLRVNPSRSLLRVRLTAFDPGSLLRDIGFRLRHLVPEADRTRLYDMLFAKFHKGIESRTIFRVRDLIEAARRDGIEFFTPPTFEPTGLSAVMRGALCVLQECPGGLPAEVLAAGLNCSKDELAQELSKYAGRGVVVRDDELWSVIRFKPTLAHDDGGMRCSRTLVQLLEFLKQNRTNPKIIDQLSNAIALGKACRTCDPGLVATLFWKLQSLLKRKGDKHLVFEVANLSIDAARTEPRNREQHVKGEAVARICGLSWVYQRTGRLEEAKTNGLKSHELGEKIGWDRNTAFCLKCIGRLFRLEAERKSRGDPKFAELVQSSVDKLVQAIEAFSKLSDGDRVAEVGDCYSLLGRTYLVAANLQSAANAVREARDRITDKSSKDYADLLILEGDLARENRDRPAAESYYDEAIRTVSDTADAEKSEIAARAYFAKGVLTRDSHDSDLAAQIWDRLGESDNADMARWLSKMLKDEVPASALDVLKAKHPSVRIEVMRLHSERLLSLSGSYRGRRAEPDKKYWQDLTVVAEENVAVRRVEW